jgi:peroxiredoxin
VDQWKVTKHLIQIPQFLDTEAEEEVSIETAFPFLSKLKKAFVDTQFEPARKINWLFVVPTEGAQHSLKTWTEKYQPMQELGPLTLEAPDAFLGPKSESMWQGMRGHLTETALKRLTEIPAADQDHPEWLLIIFRKNLMCDGCNREETRLVEQYADLFKVNHTNIVIVSPDDRTNEEKPQSTAVSVVGDSSLESFKQFGAFDEFTDEVTHGVFLVDHHNKIRWSQRSPHAFADWKSLSSELMRLRLIHN